MKRIVIVVVAALTLALFGASSVMAADAAANFKSICSVCHGMKGEGKKGLCPSLRDSQFVGTASATEIKDVILDGRSGSKKKYKDYPSPMPAHKGRLKDDDSEALAKYLKEVIQKQ